MRGPRNFEGAAAVPHPRRSRQPTRRRDDSRRIVVNDDGVAAGHSHRGGPGLDPAPGLRRGPGHRGTCRLRGRRRVDAHSERTGALAPCLCGTARRAGPRPGARSVPRRGRHRLPAGRHDSGRAVDVRPGHWIDDQSETAGQMGNPRTGPGRHAADRHSAALPCRGPRPHLRPRPGLRRRRRPPGQWGRLLRQDLRPTRGGAPRFRTRRFGSCRFGAPHRRGVLRRGARSAGPRRRGLGPAHPCGRHRGGNTHLRGLIVGNQRPLARVDMWITLCISRTGAPRRFLCTIILSSKKGLECPSTPTPARAVVTPLIFIRTSAMTRSPSARNARAA